MLAQTPMLELPKYSIGTGDRFGHQGKAQLASVIKARDQGADIAIVWNKSHREHSLVGTTPAAVRQEADDAVRALGFRGSYFVDADHIGASNVAEFLAPSDFFTLDVADAIGKRPDPNEARAWVAERRSMTGTLTLPGLDEPLVITEETLQSVADNYLLATRQAAELQRTIAAAKGEGRFIIEVSMDETASPQSPVELLLILAALAEADVPAQTIAPKFTGRFNKGVDYVGDIALFERELRGHLSVIAFAVREYGLPADLKLSVHSGSDKFSLYPAIRRALEDHGAGLHLKTAGTTWLEELIGLAEAGGNGLAIATECYAAAYQRLDELCRPYVTVIEIDPAALPAPQAVARWSGREFAQAVRHDSGCPQYNAHMRQLLHVAYKVAAEMGSRFTDALSAEEALITEAVTRNLYERHLVPVFGLT